MTPFGGNDLDNLVATLVRRADDWRPSRLMVALTGGPGAGKSTVAAAMVRALNAISPEPRAVYVPMDGFHKNSALLREEGTTALKGKPETFDVKALHAFLRRLQRGDRDLLGPAYSRRCHDVVPDAYEVHAEQIAIVEGNYLLLDTAEWRPISEIFDYKIFLCVSEATAKERLWKRHLEHGRSAEWTAQHLEEVDLPNFRLVAPLERYADAVISGESPVDPL